MKNIWIYYLLITLPLLILGLIGSQTLGGSGFVIYLLAYALVYRPIADGARLKAVSNIESSELWKLYIPFYGHTKYFKQLYLKTNS